MAGRWPQRTLEERLWSYVDKRGPDDCWPWIGASKPEGYGVLRVDGKNQRVTRLIMNAPSHLIVRHTCDNPPCCNPEHLLLGTYKDNSRDMIERGRRIYTRKERLSKATGRVGGKFGYATHCIYGHPFSGSNLILKPNSAVVDGIERLCKMCRQRRGAEQAARRKMARQTARLNRSTKNGE